MAINPNTALPNRNQCFVAMSGFGKSQAMKASIPYRGVRLVLWDPDNDHPGEKNSLTYYYQDKRSFVRALISACRSGQGFRIAWDGDVSVETFEWWCSVVWAVLDGNKQLIIGIEELADVSASAGKATNFWGQLNRKVRKYGGILLWTTQRSQEVSKTAYSQCAIKCIGYPNDGANLKDLAKMVGKSEAELLALQPLQFYRREHINTEFKAFKYVPNYVKKE